MRRTPTRDDATLTLLVLLIACGSSSTSGTAPATTAAALASIAVTPATTSIVAGATQQFNATGRDAGGNTLTISPTWTVVAGGGTISASGLFTAGAAAGSFANTVRAASGAIAGTASVTVTAPPALNTSAIASGKILFAATGTANPDDPYRLFVMNADGTGRSELTTQSDISQSGSYFSPTIQKLAGGGWRLAYSVMSTLRTFTTSTGIEATYPTPVCGDRPSLSPDGSLVAYQGGATCVPTLNIWLANADGSGTPRAVTTLPQPGAEWPYFIGSTKLLITSGGQMPPHRVIGISTPSDDSVPSPGGFTVGHASILPGGTEFLSAQKLTSYVLTTGAVGTINDLKGTTTMLAQLQALGLAQVPSSTVAGQGMQGSFALSADLSGDGARLVFDALVADATTGALRGIATFTWDLAAKHLVLIYGPEPLTGARTNNYNYSLGTPRWIP